MPREIHRVVQYPQQVDRPFRFTANSEQNDVPAAPPDMQRVRARAYLIASPSACRGRTSLQTRQ